ncbi:MAG: polysaccharide biosynthesis C-terminal domain-containing protein, partial [Bacteroidetes bacterium]|nr:polysaccharide biosynthesis C-terminal domain-containing protein [Bacteroidota bacterium]
NLVLDYLCLLYFGFYGAAIGSFITITASSVLWYFVMRKQVGLDIRSLSSYIRQFYKNLPSMTSDFLGNRKA